MSIDIRTHIDNLTAVAVAKLSEVGPSTITDLESKGWPRSATLQLLARAQATGLVTRSVEGVYGVAA